MRYAILAMLAAVLLAGCATDPNTQKPDWQQTVENLRAAGFKGHAVLIWGMGTVGGQAFNLSGSNGYLDVEINPSAAPTSQPAP